MMQTNYTIQGGNEKYGVPVGNYKCVFEGIEEKKMPNGDETIQWTFIVTEGDYQGRKIDGLTDHGTPTVKNKFGRFLAGLEGKPPEPGKEVEIADHYGNPYMVFVSPNKNNKPAIYSFSPLPE